MSYRTATGGDAAPGLTARVLRGDGVRRLKPRRRDGSERVTLVGAPHQATSSRGDGDAEGAEVRARGAVVRGPARGTAWPRRNCWSRRLRRAFGDACLNGKSRVRGARTADENKRRCERAIRPTSRLVRTTRRRYASALEAALNGGSQRYAGKRVGRVRVESGDDRRTVSSTVTTVSSVTAPGAAVAVLFRRSQPRPGRDDGPRARLRDAALLSQNSRGRRRREAKAPRFDATTDKNLTTGRALCGRRARWRLAAAPTRSTSCAS